MFTYEPLNSTSSLVPSFLHVFNHVRFASRSSASSVNKLFLTWAQNRFYQFELTKKNGRREVLIRAAQAVCELKTNKLEQATMLPPPIV
jgi:hypothetical protein